MYATVGGTGKNFWHILLDLALLVFWGSALLFYFGYGLIFYIGLGLALFLGYSKVSPERRRKWRHFFVKCASNVLRLLMVAVTLLFSYLFNFDLLDRLSSEWLQLSTSEGVPMMLALFYGAFSVILFLMNLLLFLHDLRTFLWGDLDNE